MTEVIVVEDLEDDLALTRSHGKTEIIVAEIVAATVLLRCTRQLAQTAERHVKFHFVQMAKSQYTAATVSVL
jgi:hypothetical protein